MKLYLKNFSKSYGKHQVIKAVNLELPQGLTLLKGMNGSGKSTFMRSLAGIVPSQGEIYFENGVSLKDNPQEFRSRIHYTAAEPHFPHFLRGEEILDFYKDVRRGTEEEVGQLCHRLGIGKYLKYRVNSYSSGMLKKISLVTGLIGKPQVLALDEPYTTIDNATQLVLRDIIKERLDARVSVLLASHHEVPELEGWAQASFEIKEGIIEKN